MNGKQQIARNMQKSDFIVFFLATMIVCTLVGKGIFSLCETNYSSIVHKSCS